MLLVLCVPVRSGTPDGVAASAAVSPAAARLDFLRATPGTRLLESSGRIERVYGRAFSHGQTAMQSAESFRLSYARIFGALAEELVPIGPGPDGQHVQPIMYDQVTGTYKFTGLFYTQQRQGIPVFGSALKLIVRNEAGYPLVLASADLRNLGNLQVDADAAGAMQPVAVQSALQRAGQLAIVDGQPQIASTRRVIFAGVDDMHAEPRLADESIVEIDIDRWLIVTDARTGEVLYEEHLIYTVDIDGTAEGLATEGIAIDECEEEVLTAVPYMQVTAGANSDFTDANGDFSITNPGTDPINVTATLGGAWFDLIDHAGPVESVSVMVTPPGPAELVFNATNASEFLRAEVNGYIQANVIRDFVLELNPAYPTLNFGGFNVTVNRTDGVCPQNAWYDGSGINFCRSNGNAPNTAWSSVIYHEYGHHLVAAAGSGQGQYGEGTGDVMSVLILDDPRLGLGFFGNCNQSLRNADNSMQYPCNGAIHTCGQLISGCVWSTRNYLIATEPVEYLSILSNIAVNAILLHTGSSIAPSITVDYLTLDDDDADILNGTPHYDEINAGFSDHNMPGPVISLLAFDFPSGLPSMIVPSGGTTVPVEVSPVTEDPVAGTGKLLVDSGGGFTEISMTEITPNNYDAVFPVVDCGTQVAFYFTAETTGGNTAVWPADAPQSTFTSISGTGSEVAFSDDFETDTGWTVQTTASDGAWQRAVPIPNSTCDRGNPGSDADGSGMCYVTDNSAANSCNSDVDSGNTVLTSRIFDVSEGETYVSYWRWFSNIVGDGPNQDIFRVQVSDDGGTSWTVLEDVGPGGVEVEGGWYQKEFRIADFVTPNDQFRIQFIASDTDPQSVVEAGVDGFQLLVIQCAVFADLDGDGLVGITDFLQLLEEWGPCPGPCPPSCAADLDGDCNVGITDFLLLLENWT